MWVKENLENTINSKIFINIKKIDLDEDLANKNIDILKNTDFNNPINNYNLEEQILTKYIIFSMYH